MGNYHELKAKKLNIKKPGKLVRLGDVPVSTYIYATPDCVFGEIVILHTNDGITKVQHYNSWDMGNSTYEYILKDSDTLVYVNKEDIGEW